MSNTIVTKTQASGAELDSRQSFSRVFGQCPIPDDELLTNLSLFMKRQDVTRMLFMNDLYTRMMRVHGVVMEFGVRWGRDLALFEALRGIHEPYNHTRKIVGFDTFTGFPSSHAKDGSSDAATAGVYSTTENYVDYLEQVLEYHESESPLGHIKKYELVEGDVMVQLDRYLRDHPETIVAFAYFDLDLYEPTKKCLESIRDRLTKGSVIGFDELNLSVFPGETIAVKEVLGLDRYSIRRSPYSACQSYIVVE